MPIRRIDIGSSLSPQEKIQRARYQLALRNPFLGALLYEFPIVLTKNFDDCPTAYIDFERRVIVINECFARALTIPELMQVIAHEIFHVIQYAQERGVEIGARASQLDWELWNIAVDYLDNLTLQDFGIGKLPEVWLDLSAGECRYYNKEGRGEKLRFYIDERFRGWTAEEIFLWMKKYGITKKIGPLTRVIVPLPTNCPVCGGSGRVQDPQTGTSTGCPVCGGTGKVPSFQPPKRPCPTCGGTGKITKPDGTEETCPTCGGTGEVLGAPQPMPQPQRCPTCDGTGRTPCPTCGGTGNVTEPTTGQKKPCPTCGGSGTVTCPTCDGEGEVVPCPTCGGSGSVTEPGTGEVKPCPTCGGSGVVPPHKIPPEAIPPPSPPSGVEGEDYIVIDQFDLPPRGSGREGRPGRADVEKNRDSVGRSWGTARTPGWERIVEEVLRPALPWKVLLERFIRQSAKVDYRWIPPCVPPNTMIATKEFHKPIEEIKEGDYVLSHDGQLHRVEKKWITPHTGHLFRVKCRYCLPFEITGTHIVPVRRLKYKKMDKKGHKYRCVLTPIEWKKVEELKKGELMGIPIPKGIYDIKEIDLSKYISKHMDEKIEKSNKLMKALKLDYDMAELMGIFVAEGHASNSYLWFNPGKHETSLINRIVELSKKCFNLADDDIEIVEDRRENVDGLTIRYYVGRHVERFFREQFGHPAKNKRIPSFILYHKDLEILRRFLKGYWLGDGNHHGFRRSNRISFRTSSKILARQLQLAFARFGIVVEIYQDRDESYVRTSNLRGTKVTFTGPGFQIRTRHPKAFELLDLEPPKKKRFQEFFKISDGMIWVRVNKIEKVEYTGLVYDLQVEGAGTYTVENVAVHNSKKTYPHGIILPGLAGEKLTVVIAVDSSSSITDQEFQWFVSETLAILNTFEAVEAWIIVCDNEIKGVQRIMCRGQRVDPSIWRGGGGTCFRPVFEFVKVKGIRPDVLIYFTDLECYDREYCYPDFIPPYPVLWVFVKSPDRTTPPVTPPFGTIIEYRRPRVV